MPQAAMHMTTSCMMKNMKMIIMIIILLFINLRVFFNLTRLSVCYSLLGLNGMYLLSPCKEGLWHHEAHRGVTSAWEPGLTHRVRYPAAPRCRTTHEYQTIPIRHRPALC